MHVAQASDAVGLPQPGADLPVHRQRRLIALAGALVFRQHLVHVAQALDAVRSQPRLANPQRQGSLQPAAPVIPPAEDADQPVGRRRRQPRQAQSILPLGGAAGCLDQIVGLGGDLRGGGRVVRGIFFE